MAVPSILTTPLSHGPSLAGPSLLRRRCVGMGNLAADCVARSNRKGGFCWFFDARRCLDWHDGSGLLQHPATPGPGASQVDDTQLRSRRGSDYTADLSSDLPGERCRLCNVLSSDCVALLDSELDIRRMASTACVKKIGTTAVNDG